MGRRKHRRRKGERTYPERDESKRDAFLAQKKELSREIECALVGISLIRSELPEVKDFKGNYSTVVKNLDELNNLIVRIYNLLF